MCDQVIRDNGPAIRVGVNACACQGGIAEDGVALDPLLDQGVERGLWPLQINGTPIGQCRVADEYVVCNCGLLAHCIDHVDSYGTTVLARVVIDERVADDEGRSILDINSSALFGAAVVSKNVVRNRGRCVRILNANACSLITGARATDDVVSYDLRCTILNKEGAAIASDNGEAFQYARASEQDAGTDDGIPRLRSDNGQLWVLWVLSLKSYS